LELASVLFLSAPYTLFHKNKKKKNQFPFLQVCSAFHASDRITAWRHSSATENTAGWIVLQCSILFSRFSILHPTAQELHLLSSITTSHQYSFLKSRNISFCLAVSTALIIAPAMPQAYSPNLTFN